MPLQRVFMLVFFSAGPVQCLYRNIRGAAAHCCGCDDRVHADCERLPVHLPHTHSVFSAVEKHGVHHHQHTQACRAFNIQAASGLGILVSAFEMVKNSSDVESSVTHCGYFGGWVYADCVHLSVQVRHASCCSVWTAAEKHAIYHHQHIQASRTLVFRQQVA